MTADRPDAADYGEAFLDVAREYLTDRDLVPGSPIDSAHVRELIRIVTARAAQYAERPDGSLDAALRVALSVALHEALDPECTGEPPYDVTEGMAERVMATPVVLRALTAKLGEGEG